MEKLKHKCQHCNIVISYKPSSEGRTTKCPKCNNSIQLKSNENIIEDSGEVVTQKPSIKPVSITQTKASSPTNLPERMKASKTVAGKSCSLCSNEIELGDNVYNCQSCKKSSMHLDCYEEKHVCGNSICNKSANAAPKPKNISITSEPEKAQDTKDCRYCGETIKKNSRKCRFCGEFLDPKLRSREQRNSKSDYDDDKLSIGEIIFGLLCGGIACIVGIVFIIQGKKKGWKLLGLSIISQAFWTFIRLLNNPNY